MQEQDLKQEHIDEYVANTSEFWKETYKSLKAPFHPWREDGDASIQNLIQSIANTEKGSAHLEHILFQLPILKGEYLLIFGGNEILTNYRLIIKDNTIINIPLYNIISYNIDIKYKINEKEFELNYTEGLREDFVNNAIARDECKDLNDIQRHILSSSFYQLNKENESLQIPKINWVKTGELHDKLIEQGVGSTADDSVLDNENMVSELEKDFVSNFKSIFGKTLLLPELNKNIDEKMSSKIEMVLNNLYSEKYNKAYKSINEILEDDSQLASCWFLKALIESLNPPESKNYLDNIMLSLENFEKKVNNKEIKDKLIYSLYLIMTQNYVSKIKYNVLKTIDLEKTKQEADTAAAISGVIAGITLSNALDSDKSTSSRMLYGGATLASGKFMKDSKELSEQSEIYANSLFGVAIVYSKLSVNFLTLLKNINPKEDSLKKISISVLANWKSSNILLLNKIKLNLRNELESLRKTYKSPVKIKSIEDYDYSEFTSFQITLDLLGLDDHKIIKDNKINKFIKETKTLFTKNKDTINKYYKTAKFFRFTYYTVFGLYALANIFTGMVILLMSFFQPGCWYLLSFLAYFIISLVASRAKIHKKLSNNANEFKEYIDNIQFSETDIDESKIGID